MSKKNIRYFDNDDNDLPKQKISKLRENADRKQRRNYDNALRSKNIDELIEYEDGEEDMWTDYIIEEDMKDDTDYILEEDMKDD